MIFPGGTEVGMEIYKSLVNCKFINLFSVSSRVVNHAPYIYKDHFYIDDIYSEHWLNQLNEILIDNKIDYIFPANSYVIDKLSKHRSEIKAALILNSNEVLRIVRSKSKTYNELTDIVPVPKIYKSISEIKILPVFVKPDNAYGAQGAEKIDNGDYLSSFFVKKDNYLVMEYLPGDEYTVDCCSDADGKLIFCEGRTRQRVRMGTSMHSEPAGSELNQYFHSIAGQISERIKITGAWFFQMKKDAEGALKLLEVETRIAGTMAFHRTKGINLPLLHFYIMIGHNVDLLPNRFAHIIDRALTNRYSCDLSYDSVYVDLDDTIIVHDKINTELIKFLYQCINENKELILLSKSLQNDKMKYLADRRIADLFDSIIWLDENQSKADFVDKSKNPIFIDDSFSQRKEVSQKLGIPTFDPSMIEILLDDRK